MPTFSKTVYIEVDADDRDDAEAQIGRIAEFLSNQPSEDVGANVEHVDIAGPIEEIEEV